MEMELLLPTTQRPHGASLLPRSLRFDYDRFVFQSRRQNGDLPYAGHDGPSVDRELLPPPATKSPTPATMRPPPATRGPPLAVNYLPPPAMFPVDASVPPLQDLAPPRTVPCLNLVLALHRFLYFDSRQPHVFILGGTRLKSKPQYFLL
ncbi:uncharacterized protein [Triticum aestivum]|uniref:uncharacterized protein n=1 Tax=Triticum aestivum TaxID=4565 RepID=UPI001D00B52A|nr:uncharacterized protein LOC123105026 [Triticum aestivum]XP_044382921.1 uncharacterized protein LOC123105026 [Triticum aestivum]XP_044382923.1 uncharacterized protein LOC123105026 [Triticum aestivum]